MDMKIERILEGFALGEGPHWDINTQSLYFIDYFGETIIKYTPATKTANKVSVAPKRCSFVIPVEGKKNQFVVSFLNELAVITWDGQSDKVSVVETLCIADNSPDTPNNVFNDAKCDSTGRLWAGTRHFPKDDSEKIQPLGTLYNLDSKRQLKGQVSQVLLSNGLAFNDKIKKLYYIDSLKGTVDYFDFDIANGTVSNRQDLFTLQKHNIPGVPDGMTIDTDGNLWVAVFGGSRIIKIDGQKPETLLETINMPAEQVTSMCFGGTHLDELYVTTAAIDAEGKKAPPPPDNGATYRITGIGAKGLPGVNFKLN